MFCVLLDIPDFISTDIKVRAKGLGVTPGFESAGFTKFITPGALTPEYGYKRVLIGWASKVSAHILAIAMTAFGVTERHQHRRSPRIQLYKWKRCRNRMA